MSARAGASLTTERLRLRPFELTDAPAVERLAGEREIAAGTLTVPHPYPRGAAEAWIAAHAERRARGDCVIFAVVERAPGADADAPGDSLRGAIGLDLDDAHRRAELGYWIGRPFWGRGLATEAARAVLDHGFGTLGLHRIHAAYFAHNARSGRVLEKLGMRREGTLREHYLKWGRFTDSVVMGILRDEHEALRAGHEGGA